MSMLPLLTSGLFSVLVPIAAAAGLLVRRTRVEALAVLLVGTRLGGFRGPRAAGGPRSLPPLRRAPDVPVRGAGHRGADRSRAAG
jgi:hypothetical protein